MQVSCFYLKTKQSKLLCLYNLRIRHKKCDEAKPACSQCTRTGRKCDFLPASGNVHSLAPHLRSDRHGSNSVFAPQYLSFVPLRGSAAHYFQFFQHVCTKDFSLYFEIGLWGRIILRAACSEPCIMHAVLAIGALGRRKSSSQASVELDPVSDFPLNQYILSLQALNKRLDASAQSWELAIIGSMVFITIEVLLGNDDKVRMHLRSAFAILRSPPMSPSSAEITHLLSAFSRLDVQASSFATLHDIMPSALPPIPPSFSSMDDAPNFLNSITNVMHSIFRKGSQESQRLPYSPLSPALVHDLSNIATLFTTWHHLFNSFATDHPPTDIKTKATMKILRIHHLVSEIRISTNFYRDESVYDLYLPKFSQIVNFATSLMEADQEPTSIRLGLCHILDIGLVQPLYFVARKCRDGVLRRRAIEVMEKVRKERVHDVQLLASVARWIVSVEEDGFGESDGVVMEEKRLHEVELDFDDSAKSCRITTWRRRIDGSLEKLSGLISS